MLHLGFHTQTLSLLVLRGGSSHTDCECLSVIPGHIDWNGGRTFFACLYQSTLLLGEGCFSLPNSPSTKQVEATQTLSYQDRSCLIINLCLVGLLLDYFRVSQKIDL